MTQVTNLYAGFLAMAKSLGIQYQVSDPPNMARVLEDVSNGLSKVNKEAGGLDADHETLFNKLVETTLIGNSLMLITDPATGVTSKTGIYTGSIKVNYSPWLTKINPGETIVFKYKIRERLRDTQLQYLPAPELFWIDAQGNNQVVEGKAWSDAAMTKAVASPAKGKMDSVYPEMMAYFSYTMPAGLTYDPSTAQEKYGPQIFGSYTRELSTTFA